MDYKQNDPLATLQTGSSESASMTPSPPPKKRKIENKKKKKKKGSHNQHILNKTPKCMTDFTGQSKLYL